MRMLWLPEVLRRFSVTFWHDKSDRVLPACLPYARDRMGRQRRAGPIRPSPHRFEEGV